MTARPKVLTMRRKYEADESYWLVRRWRSGGYHLQLSLHKVTLFLTWGRIPKAWELSFLARMSELEGEGLAFNDVLLSTLPKFLGVDTSEVLRSWVGGKARGKPDQFVRTIHWMFGASARSVLDNIASLADAQDILESSAPRIAAYQSLVEAIKELDASTMSVSQLGASKRGM